MSSLPQNTGLPESPAPQLGELGNLLRELGIRAVHIDNIDVTAIMVQARIQLGAIPVN